MGGTKDKLFLEANGTPIIGHTWKGLDRLPHWDEVIVVIREERREEFERVADQLHLSTPFRLIPGGAERQDSVWNGVCATHSNSKIVAIHDAARPCINPRLFDDCLAKAGAMGACVAASRVADTLKRAREDQTIETNIDRTGLWAVQTPQVFRREIILAALRHVREHGLRVTDDTAACEFIDQPVALVESAAANPKVTVPADLPFVEWLLARAI